MEAGRESEGREMTDQQSDEDSCEEPHVGAPDGYGGKAVHERRPQGDPAEQRRHPNQDHWCPPTAPMWRGRVSPPKRLPRIRNASREAYIPNLCCAAALELPLTSSPRDEEVVHSVPVEASRHPQHSQQQRVQTD